MASILLVEDDDQLRTMLKLLLTSSGYDVTEAANGAHVRDMYQEHHFDLVITDLVMPDMDGFEVIMELRRRDQNVRIMAISGGKQVRAGNYLRIAQQLGVQRTLSKPFGNEQFLQAVREIIDT